MRGHQDHSLSDFRLMLPVMCLCISRQLVEIVIQPFPFLHLVGLLKVDDRGFSPIHANQVRGPRILVRVVNHHFVSPDLIDVEKELLDQRRSHAKAL